ncbi:hypothetical protein C8F01DRAFT_1147026 [Mycena amicta]|nr:hypothetical protein C8F01DRAFT_1147026 [Mycena amicta]
MELPVHWQPAPYDPAVDPHEDYEPSFFPVTLTHSGPTTTTTTTAPTPSMINDASSPIRLLAAMSESSITIKRRRTDPADHEQAPAGVYRMAVDSRSDVEDDWGLEAKRLRRNSDDSDDSDDDEDTDAGGPSNPEGVKAEIDRVLNQLLDTLTAEEKDRNTTAEMDTSMADHEELEETPIMVDVDSISAATPTEDGFEMISKDELTLGNEDEDDDWLTKDDWMAGGGEDSSSFDIPPASGSSSGSGGILDLAHLQLEPDMDVNPFAPNLYTPASASASSSSSSSSSPTPPANDIYDAETELETARSRCPCARCSPNERYNVDSTLSAEQQEEVHRLFACSPFA